jgi:hypothetical protein
VGVGVTQDRHDGDQLIPAIDEIEDNTGRRPEQMVADGGYIKNTNIDAMAEKGIEEAQK